MTNELPLYLENKKSLKFFKLKAFIGFGWRFRADSNRCRSFCRAQPSHSATEPFVHAKLKKQNGFPIKKKVARKPPSSIYLQRAINCFLSSSLSTHSMLQGRQGLISHS